MWFKIDNQEDPKSAAFVIGNYSPGSWASRGTCLCLLGHISILFTIMMIMVMMMMIAPMRLMMMMRSHTAGRVAGMEPRVPFQPPLPMHPSLPAAPLYHLGLSTLTSDERPKNHREEQSYKFYISVCIIISKKSWERPWKVLRNTKKLREVEK